MRLLQVQEAVVQIYVCQVAVTLTLLDGAIKEICICLFFSQFLPRFQNFFFLLLLDLSSGHSYLLNPRLQCETAFATLRSDLAKKLGILLKDVHLFICHQGN